MKKSLFWLFVVCVAAVGQDFAFKKGLPGWTARNDYKARIFEDTVEKLSDYCSVRLEGPARLEQMIEIDEDGDYELSFYIKGKDIGDGKGQGARFVLHGDKAWQRVVANQAGAQETGTFDWKRGTGRFNAKRLRSRKINLELTLLCPGTVWFDNITIRKLPSDAKATFRQALDQQITKALFYPDGITGFFEPGEAVSMHLDLEGQGRATYTVNVKKCNVLDNSDSDASILKEPITGEFELPGTANIQLPGQESGYYVAEASIQVNGRESYYIQSAFAVTPQFDKRDEFFQFGYGVFQDMFDNYKRVGGGAISMKIFMNFLDTKGAESEAERNYNHYKPLIEGNDYKLSFCMGASIRRDSISAEDFANGLPLLKEENLRRRRELAQRLATMTKGRVHEWSVQSEVPSNATMDKYAGTWTEAMFNQMVIGRVVNRAVKQIDPTIEFWCGGNNVQNRIAPIETILFKDLIKDFDGYAIDAYTGNWNMLLGSYMLPETSLASFYQEASDLAASLGKSPVIKNEETGYAINFGAAYDKGLAVEQACLTARTIIITKAGPVRSFELHCPTRRTAYGPNDDGEMCMSTIWKPIKVGAQYRDVPLPGGAMYATIAHQLSFASFLKELAVDNCHVCLFRKEDGSTLATVWTTDAPVEIGLSLGEDALLTSMVGFETSLQKGSTKLRVTQAPLYLTIRGNADALAANLERALTAALPQLRVAATLEDEGHVKLFATNLTGKTLEGEIQLEGGKSEKVKFLPGKVNKVVVPLAKSIQVVCSGMTYPVVPQGSTIHVQRVKSKPVLDGTGAWLAGLPRGELRYPDDIYPKEALHPERCYFKTSFNPNGHNFAVDYWLGYDDEYFYLAAKADDPHHVQTAFGNYIWRGDSLQWAFATTDTIPKAVLPKGSNDKSGVTLFNYGLALTKDGVECYRFLGAAGPRHFPCKVTRTGDETFYEVAIPWKELEYSPASGKRIAFSFIVFDRNSEAEVSAPYHIGLTRGIAGGADASLYKVIVFED
ncbi:MAG: hypothetical protein IKP00_08255 [Victivallales bacterium]|nr:hypothetical protein [Victivallales bacterium]